MLMHRYFYASIYSVLISIGGSYSCMHIFWDIGNYKEAKSKS